MIIITKLCILNKNLNIRGVVLKKNITIVCLNDFLRKETGKEFAKCYNMHYLDVDELIDFELISRRQVSIKCGDEFLNRLEKECVARVAEYENCVYSISPDLFLANNNKAYLENSYIIYLNTDMHNIDISKIRNKNAKEKAIQYMEVFENVNGFLIATCPYVIENADFKSIKDIVAEIKTIVK